MEDLQIFQNSEFGNVRTLQIEGKPYFVATDVATALGYSNPRKAIKDHCKGVTKRDTPTSSGTQSMSYINEGDLYRLIMKSKLPSAERFESWVMDENKIIDRLIEILFLFVITAALARLL